MNKKKILFMDDEISGISFNEAQAIGEDFFTKIRDYEDPLRKFIETIISNQKLNIEFPEDGEISEKFFQEFILNGPLASCLRGYDDPSLVSIFSKHDLLCKIPNIIKTAFSNPDLYELTCCSNLKEYTGENLVQFDLVILDWIFNNGNSADNSNEYIRENFSKLENSPAIILLTSHSEILNIENRITFYSRTKIGAGLLIILTKDQVQNADFQVHGFRQLSEKAIVQKEFGNKFKQYIATWENTFKNAAQKTIKNLWQLDPYIVKNTHKDAILDSQPFDEHFNNFILLSHLFHIESENDLNQKAYELDKIIEKLDFSDLLNFHSSRISIETHRNLLFQYYYKGSNLPEKIFDKNDLGDFRKNILKRLPFGSIIGKLNNNIIEEAYVNITQPCNLSDNARKNDSDRSIFLMRLVVLPADVDHVKTHQSDRLTIKSLKFNGKFYDFEPKPFNILCGPVKEIYEFIYNRKYQVIGVLRPEFILGLQEAAASNLTKPSQTRIDRPCLCSAKLFYFFRDSKDKKTYETYERDLSCFLKKEEKGYTISFIGQDSFSGAHFIAKFFEQDAIKEKIYDFFCTTINLHKPNELFSENHIRVKFSNNEFKDRDPTDEDYLNKLNKNIHHIVIDYKISV